jgi:1,4-dihydroxy-6-naphthoate synthase
MNIVFSSCPNDTFVFHAWVHGLISGAPDLHVRYADIDVTNYLAMESNEYDILKISYAALPYVLSQYRLLSCGGALGRGCGPLLLIANAQETAEDLVGKRVAVPSERSTAYLLFRLWAAKHVPGELGEIQVMPFHEIMPAVQKGHIDAGLVIHEARFTYGQYGLTSLMDLGEWWEEETGYPIPLGAIVARRSLDYQAIERWIRQSVEYAWAHPQDSRSYVMQHAQEMDEIVAQQHIDLYVNHFTADLGEEGYAAISYLLDQAAQQGLVPKLDREWLMV